MNTKKYKIGDYIRTVDNGAGTGYVGKIIDVDQYSIYYPYRVCLKNYSSPSQSYSEGSLTKISKIEYLLGLAGY